MNSSMKFLAVMLGMIHATPSMSDPDPTGTKVSGFYDQLVSIAGANQNYDGRNYFVRWVDYNFADTIKYCDYTQGVPECVDRDEFAVVARERYATESNYLISADCDYNSLDTSQLSLDTKCLFTFQDTETGCTTDIEAEEYMDYDAYGAKILQYYTLAWNVISTQCDSHRRRLARKQYLKHYEPVDDTCYDTSSRNPCTAEHSKAGIFYHKSCSGCCHFIQCDAYGQATDRPCAPGTYWDQSLLTCNHNKGQCMDNTCPATAQPTPAPTPAKHYRTPKPTKQIDHNCYSIGDESPCTAENRVKDLYYFKSCDSCCHFIQCDDFGNGFDMSCAAGTYWDQRALSCNHNYGQCQSEMCGKPTPKTTPKVWTTEAPTPKPKTPCPTTPKPTTPAPSTPKPTETPSRAPTAWTKGPTRRPTTSKPTTAKPTMDPTTTATPTRSPSSWTKGPTRSLSTSNPTKAPTPCDKKTKEPTKKPTKSKHWGY